MGIMSWMFLGLIVGALAKWIMPGKDPGGIVVTMLIGIAGAFVGGFIGSLFGLGSVSGFDLASIALAVAGALVLLYGYRALKS
ncbi:MAG: GlsB/YeaQ/YmgE family stress response membrane protein [Gammaproteobacteria bacterium]|nr:GlsB/YeaQ/YmgE family stress response membrane protein [Gammaproteobacteria bacterium]